MSSDRTRLCLTLNLGQSVRIGEDVEQLLLEPHLPADDLGAGDFEDHRTSGDHRLPPVGLSQQILDAEQGLVVGAH